MATTDITALIDFYVREKDLTRERVIQALEASFITAYAKMVPGADRIQNIRALSLCVTPIFALTVNGH